MRAILRVSDDKYIIEMNREIAADWQIEPNDALDVFVVGNALLLKPVVTVDHDLNELLDEVVHEHGATLKRLSE